MSQPLDNAASSVTRTALQILPDAYACLRGRLLLLVMVLLLSGIFEGIGLAVLFPVLAKLGMGGDAKSGLLQVMDQIIGKLGIPDTLGVLLAVAVFVLYLQVIFQTWKGWCESDCQMRYAEWWRKRIFDAFMDAEWSFFTSERYAARINMIANESFRIAFALFLIEQMVTAIVFIAIYGVIALAASWQMVTILIAFGLLIYLATRPMSRHGYALGQRVSTVDEALQHRATEFIHNAKLIKSTATEAIAKASFAEASSDYRKAYLSSAFHPKLLFGIYMMAGYTLLGVGTWVSVERLQVNPAAVAVSIYIFLRLYVQLTNFQQYRQSFFLAAPAFGAVMVQVEHARTLAETNLGGRPIPGGPASVRLSDVSVRYGDVVALDGVSFDVPAGAVIGITGASGAGKSTLVDAIVGLIKPANGRVDVDGIPIAEVSRVDWRHSIGYVGQETLLLNGSVRANIAWGADADESEIAEAARAAHAHGFVAAMPRQYDTEIGDRGVRLSGGQRQRLGLARALLGKRRLLILDEATSALDSESENEIMSALAAMRGQVTILIIAHRLSTLRMADRILVFEHGRLAEAGMWHDLAQNCGVFSRLLELQNSGATNRESTAVP
jgi:ATP-binding cassette, subfamily C, bacterial